jgi:hypothetical protein
MRIKKPAEGLVLTGMNLIMAFEYETKDTIQMKMQTLALV